MIRRAAVALAVAAVALGATIALRAERIVAGEDASVRVEVAIAPDVALGDLEATWRARLRGHPLTIELAGSGEPGLVVEVRVGGVRRSDAERVARALDQRGSLAFRWVAADTEVARAWYARFRDGVRPGGVRAEIDHWSGPDGSTDDYYLRGDDRQAVLDALARDAADLPVSPDLELMFEDIQPPDDDRSRSPYVRTYLVERATILTQADVAEASIGVDPYTSRPQVQLDFTRAGGRAFGEATASRTGAKLAIVRDDVVASAPVVMSAIPGGRAVVTMSVGSPQAQRDEAEALVASLGGGGDAAPLPAGLRARVVAIDDEPSPPWLPRLVIALGAGLLAWLLVPVLARRGCLAARLR
ncbi:MAG: hypothetical protein IPL61_19560 [Myxococcales bacterium]|nr:hypothetical protein [Myxococcales bacterium]